MFEFPNIKSLIARLITFAEGVTIATGKKLKLSTIGEIYDDGTNFLIKSLSNEIQVSGKTKVSLGINEIPIVDITNTGINLLDNKIINVADPIDNQDVDTKTARDTAINTAIGNLLDSAPEALDTLNELAAALADDAEFATTISNLIALKLPLAGGTMTGDLILNADLKMAATKKLYFDGGDSTYITEFSPDILAIYAGNQNIARFSTNNMTIYKPLTLAQNIRMILGKKVAFDADQKSYFMGETVDLLRLYVGEQYLASYTSTYINFRKSIEVDNNIIKKGDNGSKMDYDYITEDIVIGIGQGAMFPVPSILNLLPNTASIKSVCGIVITAPGGGATMFQVCPTGDVTGAFGLNINALPGTKFNMLDDGDGSLLVGYGNSIANTIDFTTDFDVEVSEMIIRIIVYYEQLTEPTG